MRNSKHIFIQIDTDSIILLENEIQKGTKKAANELIRAHTLVYDQGSMSLGNPIKYFTISGSPGQVIHFSIVPLQLFSHHKLYFSGFICENKQGIKIPSIKSHQLSFTIDVENTAEEGNREFCLQAVLEYDEGKKIDVSIDPVIQIKQD